MTKPLSSINSSHHSQNHSLDHNENNLRDAMANLSVGGLSISGGANTGNQAGPPSSGVVQQPYIDGLFGGHAQQYGSYDAHETAQPLEHRKRGESIDIFLSRSPSQSLGTDFLNFRVDETTNLDNMPPLSIGTTERSLGSSAHGDSPHVKRSLHGSMSPSGSITGTSASSRSTSPSWNHAGDRKGSIRKTIMAYDGYQHQQAPTQGFSNPPPFAGYSTSSAFSSHSNAPTSSYDTDSKVSTNQGYKYTGYREVPSTLSSLPGATQDFNTAGVMQPQQIDKPQQGQVFYMAVQGPDGQQVLQPVQMLQLPGQPNAFVLPQTTGNTISHQPQLHTVGMHQTGYGIPQTNPGGSYGGLHQSNSNVYMGERVGRKPQNSSTSSYFPGGGKNRSVGGSAMVANQRHSVHDSVRPGFDDDTFGYRDDSYGGQHVQDELPFDPLMSESERKQMLTNNEIVANLYASPKRPPLRELLGHVRRLSRDQVGCRLLQQALDEEGGSAATAILNEGLSFWGEAMVDPFGNYLFQKILEKITPEERVTLVKSVSPRLVNASLNLHGTRSVQKVVELCALDESVEGDDEPNNANAANSDSKKKESAAELLTRSLSPAAARLCIDSHGNHVIQRILLKLPYKYSQFVFEAVANSVGDVARHRHGCCVIQRCLDSPPSEARAHLVRKIVEKSLDLMQDAYGNYVVQYVLDVCSDEDVHAVCESVVGKVSLLAIQKFSSNVMEKCLERCTDKVREAYLEELSDPDRIRELMMDPFGNYVIQRALAVASHSQALTLVDATRPHLISSNGGGIRNTAGGRRILAKIERRFPHFNINEEGSIERAIHRKSSAHLDPPMPRLTRGRGGPPHPKRGGYHQYQDRYQEQYRDPYQAQLHYQNYPTGDRIDPNYMMMGGPGINYDQM